MQFKKTFPYKLKRALPILGLAGASLFASCDKESNDEPTHDVQVFIVRDDFSAAKEPNLSKYINQPDVRYIYIIPQGPWNNMQSHNIVNIRKNVLEPAIKLSPKVRGSGDFNFWEGHASLVPEDSLWYVKQGWTINRYLDKHR